MDTRTEFGSTLTVIAFAILLTTTPMTVAQPLVPADGTSRTAATLDGAAADGAAVADTTNGTAGGSAQSATVDTVSVTVGHEYDRSYNGTETIHIWASAASDTDPLATPVSDADLEVRVNTPDGEQDTFDVTTDDDGTAVVDYDLSGRPSGYYTVSVSGGDSDSSSSTNFYAGEAERLYPRYRQVHEEGESLGLSLGIFNGTDPVSGEDRTATILKPDRTSETVQVTTGDDGFADVSFTPEESGRYRVNAGEAFYSITTGVATGQLRVNGQRYEQIEPGTENVISGAIRQNDEPYADEQITISIVNRTYGYDTDDVVIENLTTTTSDNGQYMVSWEAPDEVPDSESYSIRLYTADGEKVSVDGDYVSIISEAEQTTATGGQLDLDASSEYDEDVAPGSTQRVTATVRDENDDTVANQDVVFTVEYNDVIVKRLTATTNMTGVATASFDVAEDAPLGADIDVEGAATYDGQTLRDTAYSGYISEVDWDGEFDDRYAKPGEELTYTLTATDTETDQPLSDVPVSVQQEYEGFSAKSFFTDRARTNASGMVSFTAEVPEEATGHIQSNEFARGMSQHETNTRAEVRGYPLSFSGVDGYYQSAGSTLTFNYTTPTQPGLSGHVVVAASDGTDLDGDRVLYADTVESGETVSVDIPDSVPNGTYYEISVHTMNASGRTASATDYIRIGSPGYTPDVPAVTLSPSSEDFGTVATSNESTREFTLDASERTNVTLSVVGDDAGAFTIEGDANRSLTTNGTETVTVAYAPESGGDKEAELLVENGTQLLATAELSGSAVEPDAEIDTESLTFGGTTVGETATRTVTVENVGETALTVTDARFAVSDADFEVTPATPLTVPAGESRDLTVSYAPSTAAETSKTLTISTDDPDEPATSIWVSTTNTTGQVTVTQTENTTKVNATVENVSAGSNVSIGVPPESDEEAESGVDSVSLSPTTNESVSVNITESTDPVNESVPEPDYGNNGTSELSYISIQHSVSNENISEATVTYRVNRSQLDRWNTTAENVSLYRYEGNQTGWVKKNTTAERVDNDTFLLSAGANGLSEWTAAAARPYINVTDTSVDVTAATTEETVNIGVLLENSGGASGVFVTKLLLNETVVERRQVTLASNATRLVEFGRTFEQPGDYRVLVNDVFVATVNISQTDQSAEVTQNVTEVGAQTTEGSGSGGGTWFFGPLSPVLTVVAIFLTGATLLLKRRRRG